MRTHRPTRRSRPLLALLALLAILAAGCGTSTAQVSAERATEAPSPILEPPVEYGATLEEYGASLNEFEESVDDVVSAAPTEQAQPTQPAELGHARTIDTSGGSGQSTRAGVTTIAWADLIPPGFSGPEIMTRFAEKLNQFEVGSAEAREVYQEMQAEFESGAINEELDGQEIRLAGFVAPLTYVDDVVVEFLLVPNFGACIHVPPPPPNQTIMVTVDKENGLTPEEAWGAVWVEGTMNVSAITTDLAEASYTITDGISGVYNEF